MSTVTRHRLPFTSHADNVSFVLSFLPLGASQGSPARLHTERLHEARLGHPCRNVGAALQPPPRAAAGRARRRAPSQTRLLSLAINAGDDTCGPQLDPGEVLMRTDSPPLFHGPNRVKPPRPNSVLREAHLVSCSELVTAVTNKALGTSKEPRVRRETFNVLFNGVCLIKGAKPLFA